MPSWKGDISNPAPNTYREPINLSEKPIALNRANEIRRDTDNQKDITISLYDIDETILGHMKDNLKIQVEDGGKQITVPIMFGSPEQWVSAQRDGYVRDYQGKTILPLIMLKRTTSDDDETLRFFNRYLSTPAMKLYSDKNKYTQFSLLNGKNAPINEIYNMVIPSHVKLNYHFVLWTEKVQQMNKLVEIFRFNTNDYWGIKQGFKFRTRVESYGHTTELQSGDDRMVKTEFDMEVHGYILPDSMIKLDEMKMTTQKALTPKKVVMGVEMVSSDFFNGSGSYNPNMEKWRNKSYPNLPGYTSAKSAPLSSNDFIKIYSQIQMVVKQGSTFHLPPPTTSNDTGEEGWISYDSDYYYIYTGGYWKRVPIALFNTTTDF